MSGEMMTITLESTVARRPNLLTSELSDREMVLLNIDGGAYFGMEGVAKRVWEQLAEPSRVADLCTALLARFAVDTDTCREEVLAFLAQLQAKDLILVSTAEGADATGDESAGPGTGADA